MEVESKYEKQILEDIRGIPPYQLTKISKLIRFFREEILGESKKQVFKKKNTFASLEGIFKGDIEHTDEDIEAAQIKLKEA